MDSLQKNILSALNSIFSHRQISDNDKHILATIEHETEKFDEATRQKFASELLQRALPPDNPVPLYFFLYDCLKDIRLLERGLDFLPARLSLSLFYEVYWNISQRVFTSTVGSAKIHRYLRAQFDDIRQDLNGFLAENGLGQFSPCGRVPKTIAIISPQLLNMRHSPTREAFSLALHLKRYHGCQVYIFNTNAMHYEGNNSLKLVSFSKYHANLELKGAQTTRIDYLDFHEEVNIISFEPGLMTTQKIAGILDTAAKLKVEAVIAHGENLLVMEALYKKLPSLFATTGVVVPFHHCDAYFVPGDLVNEHTLSQARQYQHTGEIMYEGMLVTPEGKAEQPLKREEFGLNETQWLYLVVGTRLSAELTPGFINVIEQTLEAQPDAVVIFAGTPQLSVDKIFSDHLLSAKRLLNIGFHQDLAGVSAMCDVYLNPHRNGGGTSGQTAIINDLPIVTLNYGHVSTLIPNALRAQDWEDYFRQICLHRSPEHYAQVLRQTLSYFAQNSNARAQVERMYNRLCKIALTYSR
ncbi:hypothetical protein IT774_12490 [Salinimonas marina]|uniref:Glycosyltransferase n=1 Tax=Salinimonas marina TaxID=2785918 RepID=A0A7S9HCY0_9ALTE|nr:hypothetical protein [Salinimonas marina]QPG04966.1 hypothetical protein IT774_12490 [Salinimonas marina]